MKSLSTHITESFVNESNSMFAVMLTGGSIGDKPRPSNAREFKGMPVPKDEQLFSKEDATAKAKRMNKSMSPGERKHYRLKYVVVPVNGNLFESDSSRTVVLSSGFKE